MKYKTLDALSLLVTILFLWIFYQIFFSEDKIYSLKNYDLNKDGFFIYPCVLKNDEIKKRKEAANINFSLSAMYL